MGRTGTQGGLVEECALLKAEAAREHRHDREA